MERPEGTTEVATPSRRLGFGEDAVHAAMTALIDQHPDALIAAVDSDGLFTRLPDSLVVNGQKVCRARSALDLVKGTDRINVIQAWQTVKHEGAARVAVTLSGHDGGQAAVHFFDVRAFHDVFVALIVAIDATPDQIEATAQIKGDVPRLARTLKSELSQIIYADDDVTRMLGWARDEMVGRASLDFIHPDDRDRAINAWMAVLSKPGATGRARLRHQHKDGRWIWLEFANRNLLDIPDGYIDCEMYDISEEMEAQEAVRASEQLLRRLAGALPVGVAQLDLDRRLVYSNGRLHEIFGAEPGSSWSHLAACVVDNRGLSSALDRVFAGQDVDMDLEIRGHDGAPRRHCTLALRALTDSEGQVTGAVGCLTDVTEAHQLRGELEKKATFDDLTGCLNRATVIDKLDRTLGLYGRHTAVIFVDLDGFKAANDELGHATGDALLVAVSRRLQNAVRGGDVVGRIGGDEFLIVCGDVDNPDTAVAVGQRIADLVARPFVVDGREIHLKASIGAAWAGDVSQPAGVEALISIADAAMYTSKGEGRGQPVLAR